MLSKNELLLFCRTFFRLKKLLGYSIGDERLVLLAEVIVLR